MMASSQSTLHNVAVRTKSEVGGRWDEIGSVQGSGKSERGVKNMVGVNK